MNKGAAVSKTAAIIGAGVGGMAAGIHLAARGWQVQIFERNARVGGKLNLVEQDGWRFDTGPSLLTMPDVVRDLFATAGVALDDALDLVPLDPICRYVYPDGIIFEAPADIEQMQAAISEFSERDAENFPKFLDYGRRVYDLTAESCLFSDQGDFSKGGSALLRRLNRPLDLARVVAPRSLHALVAHHFRDPHMRQIFDRYATYNGSSPYRAPAVYAIIPYVEYSRGAWYPRGGMYRLAEALSALLAKVGAQVHTETPVRAITCGSVGASGVELVGGEIVPADVVISNVDIATTYRYLVPPDFRPRAMVERLAQMEPSLSAFVLLLGTDCHFEHLQHHNIYFSHDYRQEFYDIFTRLVAPRDPTIYVCAAGRTDPTQAPAGGENLFVLVNAPYLTAEFSWAAEREGYRALVLEKLERMGMVGLREHIVYEQVITPEDLATRYGAQRGAIYGFSSNSLFAPFTRPQNRARDLPGLYFAGGSVHPGGGLPLVMLSGKIVADLVAHDKPAG
jgi:phytoene desaturase